MEQIVHLFVFWHALINFKKTSLASNSITGQFFVCGSLIGLLISTDGIAVDNYSSMRIKSFYEKKQLFKFQCKYFKLFSKLQTEHV